MKTKHNQKYFTAILSLSILIISINSTAQDNHYNKLFRYYYDNDFINILGKGTDRAYTGGTRLDIFYTKKNQPKFFIDKWMPKANENAVNTYSISLMQMAYTPNIIATTEPAVNDYPYASGLLAIHGLHSSNTSKKYNIQTEIIAGFTGHYTYADEYQIAIHKAISYQLPMGWKYQTPADILLNLNIGTEKMLSQPNDWMEIIVGAKAMLGSMQDGLYAHTMIRVGKLVPYFDGLINQYATSKKSGKNRFQAYAFFKPAVEWTVYNALLDGGIFNGRSNYYRMPQNGQQPYAVDKNIYAAFDGGMVISTGKIALMFTQKILAPQLNGYAAQVTGNLSFYVGF